MANKKVKLNDKTEKKENKTNNIKQEKYISDEAKEIRRFVIILFSVIIFVLVIYGISRVLMDEPVDNNKKNVVAGKVDYDMVTIGTMLNRNLSEYYVAIYDEENPKAVYYSTIIAKYAEEEDAIKVYYCNLGNKLNEKYQAEDESKTNPDAKSIEELSLGELTLIKIKNGKIVKYLEGLDTIREEFGI